MKREPIRASRATKHPKPLRVFYRAALFVILVLILVLAAGSLFSLVRPEGSAPLIRLGGSAAVGGALPPGGGYLRDDLAMFTGIGRLRVPLAGQPPATAVLSLSFPYPPEDRFFAEELATRVGEFRAIASSFFASLSREELGRLDETAMRSEILSRYNDILHLGRIEELFFTDMFILD